MRKRRGSLGSVANPKTRTHGRQQTISTGPSEHGELDTRLVSLARCPIGCLAASVDQEVKPRVPELVVPTSMGELRPEILAIHEAQQANLSMQLARQRRYQARQARR
eukprot:1223424-Pyramimonas_sp.AAC.1